MIDMPGAPATSLERHALKGVVALIAARTVVFLVEVGAVKRSWVVLADGLGVYLTAAALFAGALWAGLFLLGPLGPDHVQERLGTLPPFEEPAAWTPILDSIPNVATLRRTERQRLGRLIDRFVRNVGFEGCGGLVLTDQMRLTIAAEASLLALHLPDGCFGPLQTVLVYPSTFVPKRFAWVEGDDTPPRHPALGESWSLGTVILAWDDVLRGVNDPTDGHNVALHEFAHQLDGACGRLDGVPPQGSPQRYTAWTQMLERNYKRFSREARQGRSTALDHYGATNEAEFFAVATETFFERPHQLRTQYPELFGALQRYYRQDPSERTPPGEAPGAGGPASKIAS